MFQLGIIGTPLLIQNALDQGIVPQQRGATLFWAVLVLGAAVVVFAADVLMSWTATMAANRAGNQLHIGLVAHILRLDAAALGRFATGDLAVRGTRDIDVIREWLAGVPSLITGVAGFVLLLAAIASLDPLLLVVVAVVIPLVVLVNWYYPRRFGPANADLSTAHSARADAVEDLLTASVAVRGIGAEEHLVARHRGRSVEVSRQTMRVGRISASWAAVAPSLPQLGIGMGLAISSGAALRGEVTVGELTAFVTWMGLITVWVGVIEERLSELAAARTAADRITEVLAARPAVRAPEHPVPLPATGALCATGLGATGPGRSGTDRGRLAPVDLTAEPGQLVLVHGSVGSGKSTLLRLLARIDDPTTGTVTFGGVDLRAADPARIRDRITLVPQRPTALSGTIAENLRLGRDHVTDEMIEAACGLAVLDEQIATFPERYDTVVGEGGTTLSGGQLQRLALARATLRGAAVLLLDDVTSAVDAGVEQEIVRRLRAWLHGAGPAVLPAPQIVVMAGDRVAVRAVADRHVELAEAAVAMPRA